MTTFEYAEENAFDVEMRRRPAPPVTHDGKRAIPLKVFVQTIWVVVDDEAGTVTEHTDGGVTIPASEWSTFYDRWTADFAVLQATVAAS